MLSDKKKLNIATDLAPVLVDLLAISRLCLAIYQKPIIASVMIKSDNCQQILLTAFQPTLPNGIIGSDKL